MRDPELVFKAQLAASALERAWQRWRVMHGLVAEPMPAISSYVGYSLEEPWGQPRVVFGLSANDAEQLATLLNRHDCIGPVYAKVPGQQVREIAAGASRPLPVPPQAPSVIAEQSGSGEAQSAAKAQRLAGPAGEPDGPVYRQVARAAREAARHAAVKEAPGSGRAVAAQAEAGEAASGQMLAGRDQPEAVPRAESSQAGQPPEDRMGTTAAAEAVTQGQQPSSESVSVSGQETDPREQNGHGPAASAVPSPVAAPGAPSEHPVSEQGVPGPVSAEATGQSAGGDAAGNAGSENEARRGDDDGNGDGGDDNGNGPGGNGPGGGEGGGGRRAGRVIGAAGRSRGRKGGESRANVSAPKTPGGGSSAATSGSGVHSVAEGSGSDADSRPADEPGADIHDSNARAETRAASARAAQARAAEARAAEARGAGAENRPVEPAASQAADGPGPLALAASAARVATEARIKAAMRRNRPSASQGKDANRAVLAGGQGPAVLAGGQGPAVLAGGQGSAVLAGGQTVLAGEQSAALHVAIAKPEVASGANAVLFDDPAGPPYEDDIDVASAWGGPEFTAEAEFTAEDQFTAQDQFTAEDEFAEEDFAAEAAADPDVVQLRPWRGDADDDADQDPAAEDRPGHSQSGTARRNRIARGYSIPRLSRSKRPGAIPGL